MESVMVLLSPTSQWLTFFENQVIILMMRNEIISFCYEWKNKQEENSSLFWVEKFNSYELAKELPQNCGKIFQGKI